MTHVGSIQGGLKSGLIQFVLHDAAVSARLVALQTIGFARRAGRCGQQRRDQSMVSLGQLEGKHLQRTGELVRITGAHNGSRHTGLVQHPANGHA